MSSTAPVSSTSSSTTSFVAASPPKKQEEPKSKYQLGPQIDVGVVSTVYKATLVADPTVVAIKRNRDPSEFSSMKREVDILRSLEAMKARHIVGLRDHYVETPDKVYALVLEYVPLLNLDRMIRNRVGMDLNHTITITHQALEYLIDLQSKNIIHGDIKPENMFFDKRNNYLRIFDYSISIRMNIDPYYKYIQTPRYRSPEVALGKNYGCSVDVWSLACSVYELYTGNSLFLVEAGDDQMGTSYNLLHLIAQQFGMPSNEYLRDSPHFDQFYEENHGKISFKMSTSQTIIKGFDFKNRMRECGKIRKDPPEKVEQLIALLGSMLVYQNRPPPSQLLQSPIFKNEICFTILLQGSKPALGDVFEIAHLQNTLKPFFSTPLLPSVTRQCFHLSFAMPSSKFCFSVNKNSWNELAIKNGAKIAIHFREKKEEKKQEADKSSEKIKQEEK